MKLMSLYPTLVLLFERIGCIIYCPERIEFSVGCSVAFKLLGHAKWICLIATRPMICTWVDVLMRISLLSGLLHESRDFRPDRGNEFRPRDVI